MKHQPYKGESVWEQIEGTRGRTGEILNIIRHRDDTLYVINYDGVTKIYDQDEFENWKWTDSVSGGYYVIKK